MRFADIVRAWRLARNIAPDTEISALDSAYARDAGLPVLAVASRLSQ